MPADTGDSAEEEEEEEEEEEPGEVAGIAACVGVTTSHSLVAVLNRCRSLCRVYSCCGLVEVGGGLMVTKNKKKNEQTHGSVRKCEEAMLLKTIRFCGCSVAHNRRGKGLS